MSNSFTSVKIYIYKNQLTRFQLLNLVSSIIDHYEFSHNKYYSTGVTETYTITIEDKYISLLYLGKPEDKYLRLKEQLIQKLNAESICFTAEGEDDFVDLPNYKPKLINKIRYKTAELLNKASKAIGG